jgi:hypothetical protein
MRMIDECVDAAVAVGESLAATGTDGTFFAVGLTVVAVLVAVGVISVMKGRSRRGVLAALVLPVFLLGGLALSSSQPAYAVTDAPTVTTSAVIVGAYSPDFSEISISQTDATVFENCAGGGELSYQWQGYDDGWVNEGDAMTSADPIDVPSCSGYDAMRLLTTLTNSAGSVTDASNTVFTCT